MSDIFDAHVHADGLEQTSDDLVRAMDKNGVRKMCLMAPMAFLEEKPRDKWIHPDEMRKERVALWGKTGKEANDFVARIAKEKPDRIHAVSFIDQLHPNAADEVERSTNAGCIGVKLFNMNHYPYDERAFPTYHKCDELGVPIMFHAGILGEGRDSRFHHPADYEIVKMWPNLKVSLAHVGWPWTDEALATAGMGPEFENKTQIYIDLTPGAPLQWREDMLRKAFDYLPDHVCFFGTDNFGTSDYAQRIIREQLYIFDSLAADDEFRRKVLWDNAMEFFGLKS